MKEITVKIHAYIALNAVLLWKIHTKNERRTPLLDWTVISIIPNKNQVTLRRCLSTGFLSLFFIEIAQSIL